MLIRPAILGGVILLAGVPACAATEPENAAGPEIFFAGWIADALPRDYEKQEDWGRTRRVTVGLETSGRGLKLRVRKKKKDVPHGVWKHYRVAMVEGPTTPRVVIEDLRALPPGRVAATIHVSAPLKGWARTRIYQQGIHLATLTAEGHSTVYLRLDCELAVRLEPATGLPLVVIEPVVQNAEVKLLDFRLTRISNADGPLVRELGRGLEHLLEEELAPHKLTAKLNRAVEKKRDKLRLSPQDLVTNGWQRWMTLAGIPLEIQPGSAAP